MQLTGAQGRLEAEKKQGEALDKMSKDRERLSRCWWENRIEELGLDELQMFKAAMEVLKKNVTEHVHNMNGPANMSVSFFMMNGIIQLDHHLSEKKFVVINGSHGSMRPISAYCFDYGYGCPSCNVQLSTLWEPQNTNVVMLLEQIQDILQHFLKDSRPFIQIKLLLH
ncbi:hypothetical protein M0R45_031847 [Rubus argutus]|uniref:Uncharacterized protein n=1 Tax=Rubus argutus TaxID=59490 RepID=A0AAW1WIG8_RUBAR